MSWESSKTLIADGLTIDSETVYEYSNAVALNPAELAHIQITGDSGGTTDNLRIDVFTTIDASAENWDTVPITSVELNCVSGDPESISIPISGVYKFRLGFLRVGSTDTIVVDANVKTDNVDA